MDVFNIVADDFYVKKSGSCTRVFDITKLLQLLGVQWYNEPKFETCQVTENSVTETEL